ncbi:hypothetical protein BH09ACT4_BH09ACT4_11730 [soil metagenome]
MLTSAYIVIAGLIGSLVAVGGYAIIAETNAGLGGAVLLHATVPSALIGIAAGVVAALMRSLFLAVNTSYFAWRGGTGRRATSVLGASLGAIAGGILSVIVITPLSALTHLREAPFFVGLIVVITVSIATAAALLARREVRG